MDARFLVLGFMVQYVNVQNDALKIKVWAEDKTAERYCISDLLYKLSNRYLSEHPQVAAPMMFMSQMKPHWSYRQFC